jgi:hypothetical protein
MQTTQIETAQTDDSDSDDYNLRLLIERMQRMRTPEREIELAVREAQCEGRLWKREESER